MRKGTCPDCGEKWHSVYANKRFCDEKCRKSYYARHAESSQGPTLLNSAAVGAMHELLAVADLMSRGFEVYRAISPSAGVDLLVLRDGKVLRVEVTTGYRSKATDRVECKSYDKVKRIGTDHDILAVVSHDREVVYIPPWPVAE